MLPSPIDRLMLGVVAGDGAAGGCTLAITIAPVVSGLGGGNHIATFANHRRGAVAIIRAGMFRSCTGEGFQCRLNLIYGEIFAAGAMIVRSNGGLQLRCSVNFRLGRNQSAIFVIVAVQFTIFLLNTTISRNTNSANCFVAARSCATGMCFPSVNRG